MCNARVNFSLVLAIGFKVMPMTDSIVSPREEASPYSAGTSAPFSVGEARGLDAVRRIRTLHLAQAKQEGEKFSMLTCYDAMTAQIFDTAGIEVLLVGDSAGNVVLGQSSTLEISLNQLIPLVRAVSSAAQRALVLADLPFGSYEESPAQAVRSAVRLMKEGGAHAVKMEATAYYTEHVQALTNAGIPVMAHVGFTPQSEHALGGFRVQGRAGSSERILSDALALQEAGAFAVLAEMVTLRTASLLESSLSVPTIGIGAGPATTGQVLVWQDAFGLNTGQTPRFVKKYADLAGILSEAARTYRADVRAGTFPADEHSFKA